MEHEELLRRFRPQLVYDSQEAYFADHPAQMLANAATVLRRADGTELASAREGALTLDALVYPDRDRSDVLAVTDRDYAAQYVALREDHQELKNYLVARAKRDRDGRLWLQYWLWYFFNDYRLAASFGLHEGDWELVQLRLDAAEDQPDYAVFAQHAKAERRPWDRVAKDPENADTALVYVARGSHASYFRPGVFETEVWADVCDGGRVSPPSRLLILPTADDDPADWSGWPGRWGDTKAGGGIAGKLESDSPSGPCRKKQWKDPRRLFDDAYDALDPADPLPGPEFHVGRRDGVLVITYNLRKVAQEPRAVVITVNSPDEPTTPPQTFTFPITERHGKRVTPIPVHPERAYEVLLSVEFGVGAPTASVCRSLDPGDHEPHRIFTTALGAWVFRLIAKLRGRRR
jgi:hypothetical protein